MWQTVSPHRRTNLRATVTATLAAVVAARIASRAIGLLTARTVNRPNSDATRTELVLRFMRGLLERVFGE